MHRHDACRLTLTSPRGARIEENTYLAYVFANWADYAVAVCVPHNRRRRTRQVGLVNLLTGEEKEHIIDSKAAAGLGSRLGNRCRGCFPGRFEVDHRAKFASSVVCGAGARGWGRGSWIAGA